MLSYNRALEAKNLLVQYGVNKSRLLVSGLGATMPFEVEYDTLELKRGMSLSDSLIDSFAFAESKRIAHQLNRRISIDILRIDFVPRE
jgi:outer membrane protein OmpA-like peptidoglycan-associated protein